MKEEIAIVTGSNRGIGFACVKECVSLAIFMSFGQVLTGSRPEIIVMSTKKGILEQSKVLKVIMTTRKAANGEKAKQELLKTFSAADVDRVIIAELDLGRVPRTSTGFNRSERVRGPLERFN